MTRGLLQLTWKCPGLHRDSQIVQRIHQHLHLGRFTRPITTLQHYQRAAFIHIQILNDHENATTDDDAGGRTIDDAS